MGVKWEPNEVKMATKFESKFEVDFEVHFGEKKAPKGRQKGAQMEHKWSQSPFQEASESKLAIFEKVWFHVDETLFDDSKFELLPYKMQALVVLRKENVWKQ